MPLAPGQQLGPYEILAQLGEGGMGEVYKAKDTRLNREVALKTSKLEFSERFEREARAVAALNHPHICQLYDVGPNYLVMELIEGQQLKGPVEPTQAIEYSKQILDALDAAHRKGITHRDLKPANILVTKQGIKLLDFGLAKQDAPLQQTDATLTKALTTEGQILGTLQYMAPEQLQAKPADARSDIFAFGCILYELLTGTKAFQANTAAETIAAILTAPPPQVPHQTLNRVITKCLAKDPDDRFQSARDLKYNLTLEQPVPQQKSNKLLYAIAAATLIIGAALGYALRPQPSPPQPVRLKLTPPDGGRFLTNDQPALSPDGRTIAFAATVKDKSGLWIRPLDSSDSRYLPGTQRATYYRWSPDGRSIVFFNSADCMRVDLEGGVPTTLLSGGCNATDWASDGRMFEHGGNSVINLLPQNGGSRQPLTRLDPARAERRHYDAKSLPNGRFLFYVESAKPEFTGIHIASLSNPAERIPLLPAATYAVPLASHIVFLKGTTLFAQPFNPDTLALSGEPKTLVASISPGARPAVSSVAIAFNPTLQSEIYKLTWADRTGAPLGAFGQAELIRHFELSPDGRRVVAEVGPPNRTDLRTLNVDSNTWTRLTFTTERVTFPVWFPDSQRIALAFGRPANLFWKPASGAGAEQRLTQSPNRQWPMDISRDGRHLLYYELFPDTQRDILVLPLGPDGKPGSPKPYLRTPANELIPRFSPEPSPRWVVYVSDESGRNEIYLQSFPEPRGKWQLSTAGGTFPLWNPDGREVFFVAPDKSLTSVTLRFSGDSVQPSAPRTLFPLPIDDANGAPYAVAPGGQRFLLRTLIDPDSKPVEIILNWTALLNPKP
jgi:serine/threonine protein kinase